MRLDPFGEKMLDPAPGRVCAVCTVRADPGELLSAARRLGKHRARGRSRRNLSRGRRLCESEGPALPVEADREYPQDLRDPGRPGNSHPRRASLESRAPPSRRLPPGLAVMEPGLEAQLSSRCDLGREAGLGPQSRSVKYSGQEAGVRGRSREQGRSSNA